MVSSSVRFSSNVLALTENADDDDDDDDDDICNAQLCNDLDENLGKNDRDDGILVVVAVCGMNVNAVAEEWKRSADESMKCWK